MDRRRDNRDRSRSRSREKRARRSPDYSRRRSNSRSPGRDRRNRSRSPQRNFRDRSPARRDPPRGRSSPARASDDNRRDTGLDRLAPHKKSSDIKNERLAVLKKLTHDGNSSEEEEGAIGSRGSSRIMSETVQFNEDGATDEKEIMRIMGFSGFDSTKDHQVEDNAHSAAVGAATRNKRRIYRQYMNRRGGFNRPLQKLN